MDYKEFLKEHGVMPWQYPSDPPPDYRWKVQVPGKKGAWRDLAYVPSFESQEIAISWIQHHNDDITWLKANAPRFKGKRLKRYRLVEVPAWPPLTPEQIFENINKFMDKHPNFTL